MLIFNNNKPLEQKLTTIKGNLWLNGYDLSLPESLTVEGDVYVGNYNLTKHKLPEQLAVKVFMKWAEEGMQKYLEFKKSQAGQSEDTGGESGEQN